MFSLFASWSSSSDEKPLESFCVPVVKVGVDFHGDFSIFSVDEDLARWRSNNNLFELCLEKI